MSPSLPNPNHSPKSTLLGRLRTAVGKVRLLLRNVTPNYSSSAAAAASWRLISTLRSSTALLRGKPPRHPQRRLSLNDRRPSSLIDACDDEAEPSVRRLDSNASASSTGSTPGRVLHRTTSCPDSTGSGSGGEEEDEDVDRKAEMFITNFYRQLRLEKQVSLELRYCRGYSFGSSSDPSPGSNRSFASPTT